MSDITKEQVVEWLSAQTVLEVADNADAAIRALSEAKPKGTAGKFIKSLALSATMSPSVKIDATPYNKS